MSKNCGCAVKCEKHKKAPKDKCRRYYENDYKYRLALICFMLLGVAVLFYGAAQNDPVISIGSCVFLVVAVFGVGFVDRRVAAWRYKVHPRNLADIEQLERSLYFNAKLQKKIKPGEGEEEQSRTRSALDALRSRKRAEFEEEKRTSSSIYSDKMSELNAHLDVLGRILAGMRGSEKLCFSAAAEANKNYILGEIRHLSYPYLEDMPNA